MSTPNLQEKAITFSHQSKEQMWQDDMSITSDGKGGCSGLHSKFVVIF